jgi:hypothetical protein
MPARLHRIVEDAADDDHVVADQPVEDDVARSPDDARSLGYPEPAMAQMI